MKKTALLAVALATCLGYAPARAADVVSANVVGYNKVTINSGYTLLGAQFKLVGGATADMTELMDATSLPGMDVDAGVFYSEILLWNGVGYDTYGWSGDVGDSAYDNKWLDENTWGPMDLDAPVGKGYWIKSSSASSVTLSGEVANTNAVTVSIGVGYSLIANPFPVAISIQNIQPVGPTGMDVDAGVFYSEILLWNGVGYDTYGWSGDVGDPEYNNKWLDENTWGPATETLDIGHGCWIKSDSNGTITFSK